MQLGYLPVLFRMVPFNKSARKIWPLLELLAKNYTGARLLACSLARLLVLAKFLQLLACSYSR